MNQTARLKIVKVGTLRDNLCDIKLGDGTLWMTTDKEQYGNLWPPKIGDVVEVTIPQVVRIFRF